MAVEHRTGQILIRLAPTLDTWDNHTKFLTLTPFPVCDVCNDARFFSA